MSCSSALRRALGQGRGSTRQDKAAAKVQGTRQAWYPGSFEPHAGTVDRCHRAGYYSWSHVGRVLVLHEGSLPVSLPAPSSTLLRLGRPAAGRTQWSAVGPLAVLVLLLLLLPQWPGEQSNQLRTGNPWRETQPMLGSGGYWWGPQFWSSRSFRAWSY